MGLKRSSDEWMNPDFNCPHEVKWNEVFLGKRLKPALFTEGLLMPWRAAATNQYVNVLDLLVGEWEAMQKGAVHFIWSKKSTVVP